MCTIRIQVYPVLLPSSWFSSSSSQTSWYYDSFKRKARSLLLCFPPPYCFSHSTPASLLFLVRQESFCAPWYSARCPFCAFSSISPPHCSLLWPLQRKPANALFPRPLYLKAPTSFLLVFSYQFLYKYIHYPLFLYVHVHTCNSTCVEVWEQTISFHHMGPGDRTQVTKLDGKGLSPLSHFTSFIGYFYWLSFPTSSPRQSLQICVCFSFIDLFQMSNSQHRVGRNTYCMKK